MNHLSNPLYTAKTLLASMLCLGRCGALRKQFTQIQYDLAKPFTFHNWGSSEQLLLVQESWVYAIRIQN